jgi:hypothetical protein
VTQRERHELARALIRARAEKAGSRQKRRPVSRLERTFYDPIAGDLNPPWW